MFQFINDSIVQFKPCFKRVTTWLAFACIVIGFMVRTDVRGISSVIAALRMDPKRYTTLETAAQYTDSAGNPLLKIITRAKRCAVGYTLPPERTGKKGRPCLYGDKVSLMEVFSSRAVEFTTTTMQLYGRTKAVQYLCLDLLQRLTRQLVRFVLTKVHGTPFILMSTDLSLTPEEIIILYTLRFKIEGMFGELKHELGGFRYHFWISALEKRKRGEAAVLPTDKEGIRLVAQAKKAINVCVQ
jgi:hypothetical protein